MWLLNVMAPPPRMEPGTTTAPRPVSVGATTAATQFVDRSDELATEATVTTVVDAQWTAMNTAVAAAQPDRGTDEQADVDDEESCLDEGATYIRNTPRIQVGGQQVATGGEACLAKTSLVPGAAKLPEHRASFTPAGFVSNSGMARCHVIAGSLGGSGHSPANIFPCYQTPVNVTYMYHRMEKCVAEELSSGGSTRIHYQVELEYRSGKAFPDAIEMTAVGNGGFLHSITIQNRKVCQPIQRFQ